MRLSWKLPLVLTSAVAAAAIIGGVIAVQATTSAVRAQKLEANRQSLAVYSSAVQGYLKAARSTLEVVAADPDLARYRQAGPVDPALQGVPRTRAVDQRRHLRDLLATSDLFEYVAVLDKDGRVRVLEPFRLQKATTRTDWAYLPWGLRTLLATGQPEISDLFTSPVTRAPSILMAVPIENRRGRTVGALAAGLRLDALSRVASAPGARGTGPSYGIVTDRRGLVLAHQRNPDYVRYQTDFASVPPVARALAGRSGSGEWMNPIDHEAKLGAYRPLPGTGWAVIYATPERVALAPARRLGYAVAAATLAALVLVAGLSFLLSRRLVGPLTRLSRAAERVGEGDLSQRVAATGRDEVATLSRRFDEMVASLERQTRQLQEALNALAVSNKDLEAFTYSVAHDLRAPLRSISGFSQALSEDYAHLLGTQGGGYLERVGQAVQRMDALINDLLAWSRAGKSDMHRVPLDLSGMAEDVVGDLAQDEPRLDVDVRVEARLFAEGDERLVRVVLVNLLGNAWKFTSRTAGARIEFGRSPEQGAFFVRDNGAGFDAAQAGDMFEPFRRLHRLDEFPGTGIGLATVHRVVTRHGGQVWASGEVDRGATVYFTLGDQPAPSVRPSAEPAAYVPPPRSTGRRTRDTPGVSRAL